MKSTKLALTVSIAAFLPALAFAGTDEITNSFDRDLNREATVIQTASVASADPLVDAINVAFYGNNDSVLASFERDLNREPTVTGNTQVASVSDPLVDAISSAVQGDAYQPVMQAQTAVDRKGS